MVTTIDLALMAGRAYESTRALTNKIPTPESWLLVRPDKDDATGFEAVTFVKEGYTFRNSPEIVISFAGTDPNNSGLLTSPDGKTNAALAAGKWAEQLFQAAKYYLDVKVANPGATITLTGHSLGGGLAALVVVFFDVYAQTFDQAPFSASALNGINGDNASILKQRLKALTTTDANGQSIRTYNDTAIAALTDYVQLRDASTVNGYIPRQERVDTVRVEGEFLDGGLAGNKPFGNPQTVIPHGPADWALSSFDLHSQALLTAFLQSEKTALTTSNPEHTLSEVSKKLTPLLKMLFDKNLYAFDAAKADPNFLDLIVRHEAGVKAGDNAGTAITADAMVTRFTKDLWKLAQEGGLTVNDGNVYPPYSANIKTSFLSQALIAFAMQKYYTETAGSAGAGTELFTAVDGGVSFKRTDVAANWSDAKGKTYFESYLAQSSNGLSQAERDTIAAQIPDLIQWFVQAGTNGMNATAGTERAFMLGAKGADTLTGGSAADLLVGNAGDDILMGGKGDDILIGGTDFDTYTIATNGGQDTILDSDGQGSIVLDGTTLAGGAQYGDARVHRDAQGHLYVDAGGNRLIVDGSVIVEDYQVGSVHTTGVRRNHLENAMKRIADCAYSTRARGQSDMKRPRQHRERRTTHQGVHHA